MKRFLAVLAATTGLMLLTPECSAKADSLGINKDCDNHPVSEYGMTSITALSQYQAESKKITDAMISFCNKGKAMGDMGFEAASDKSKTESRKWADANLSGQSDEQRALRDAAAHLLYYAMLNGFSGFDYPKAPEQKDTPPVTTFSPYETCNVISSNAAEYSISQLPPNVKVSLPEWKQIKNEFEMVCLTGVMNGNSRTPVDNKLIAGLNDIARDVFYQAYQIGSKHPQYKSQKTNNRQSGAKSNAGADDLSPGANNVKQTNTEDSVNAGKQRNINHEAQEFQSSPRNAFAQRIGNTERFREKKCSVNIWFSQNGDILSIKEESGDTELCSVILRAATGMKFKPMSNEIYKIFRNTPVDFSF